jgi:hypothetical protein
VTVSPEITEERRRKEGSVYNHDIPPTGDPRWAEWCKPLLEFLETPRSHAELDAWEKENKIRKFLLPHMLAWLDLKGLVTYERKTWRKR